MPSKTNTTPSGSYNAVSLSGGKDSTFMLLRMIEEEIPIDKVLFADTGMEFPEMYEHMAKGVMIEASTLEASMRYTTVAPAGAVPFNESENSRSCATITRSCGFVCWKWTNGPESNLALAR